MRLQYIFHRQNNEPNPFKSDWQPPVQTSVALESYLEEVKTQLAEIKIEQPKQNLPKNERKALKDLKNNTTINLKKADKGTTTVIMNKLEKIHEGQIQLDNEEHYRPLVKPMVEITLNKITCLISELYQGKFIDEMTKKWLSCQICHVYHNFTPW